MWWQDIPGQPNYQASESGLVRRKETKRILKNTKIHTGYLMIRLSHNGIGKTHSVHSLIKKTFHNDPQVVIHHVDGDKANNHIDNLEYKLNAPHISEHSKKRRPPGRPKGGK